MKIVGYILAGCILLAILQQIVVAAIILSIFALLWGVLFRTQKTLGLLLTLLIFGLVGNHPIACIIFAGVTFIGVKVVKHGGTGTAGVRQAAPSPLTLSAPPGRARRAASSDFGAGDR